MTASPALVWFRNDLRIEDNPALHAAAASRAPFIALYVLEEAKELRAKGAAWRWWLAGSLRNLSANLAKRGVPLTLRRGDPRKIVAGIVQETGISTAYWNRRYVAAEAKLDLEIEQHLLARDCAVETFNASLLHEPWEIKSKAGGPIRVFTPYFRASEERGSPRKAIGGIGRVQAANAPRSEKLEDWKLEPSRPDWSKDMDVSWTRGENGAKQRLENFLNDALKNYAERRDRPDIDGTSRLSPYLAHGEISPHQIAAVLPSRGRDAEKYRAELGWREFSYHLLHYFPALARENFQRRFDAFPWRDDAASLKRWQRGLTGYPIVDAGMRQLWHTGWMHNRVRMICASFLIKHLLIDWRLGEEWFWDTLVDADPANNAASWQWVAGSGADAAPYFRIFNPVLQGEKFDPEGAYVRNWIPEIAELPDQFVHKPWEASPLELAAAKVTLGKTYPAPIVDHREARERALSAFQRLKS
ncbi:MAG: deoxyribodipyrimidine photo-lyase [Xanthobacteraceae bacterium]|nr:deoxyribodipyrimidine photo-lyase [Xanthobacteraceae bacterium]MCW5674734.1 deoxyribodipyrimidine photo-lyase [Xanthobacteraceae bacterium]